MSTVYQLILILSIMCLIECHSTYCC